MKFWFLDSNLKEKSITKTLFFLLLLFSCNDLISQRYWVSSTSANWSGNNWSNTSGGVPDGGGPPSGSDNAIFDSNGNGNCLVDISAAFDGITVNNYTGIIDINGQNFNITGTNTCVFSTGIINDTPGTSVLQINTSGLIRFNGSDFGVAIDASGEIEFDGGTFNSPVVVTHNQSSSGIGSGGCTFNSDLSVNNNSSSEIRFSNTNSDTYNGNVYLNNTGTSFIRMAYNGSGSTFNGNITVDCNNGIGIYIGQGPSSSVNLSSGTIISIGSNFSAGRLQLNNLIQIGADPLNLTFTGSAYLEMRNNHFLGNVNLSIIDMNIYGNTFDGSLAITKTGGTGSANSGGNIFNGVTTLTNTSSAYLGMGNGNPDIFNDDLYIFNQSSERIFLAQNSSGNQLNGDVYVEQNGSATGISLALGGASTISIAAGKSIYVNTGGFSSGYLELARLTQLGADPINLTLTGTARTQLGPNSLFEGNITITSPDLNVYGATYNNPVIFNKTGGTSNHNNGNLNIFNSTLEINNSSTAYFMLGYNSSDLFNGDIEISNTNGGGINFGWTGGIGTPTLASGANFSIGSGGFTGGYLRFGGFTKLGSEPITLNMPNARFYIEDVPTPCSFNSPLTVIASDLYIAGATFNEAVSFTKTGGTSNHNNGHENIFNSTLEITQQSSSYFMLGYNSNDQFNDDITVNSTNSGEIRLGHSNGTGTPTLAAGKTIFIGGTGFTDGQLFLGTFTQLGSSPINLGMGSNATFTTYNSSIGGNIDVVSGNLYLSGTTFNGTSSFEKTGNTSNNSAGGNTFQSTTDLINSGDGHVMFGNGNPDIFNDNLTITNQGTSTIYIGYNSAGNILNGDLSVTQTNNAGQIRFLDYAASTMTINGNTSLVNLSSNSNALILFPDGGQIQQNGNIDALNNGGGDNNRIYSCNGSSALLNVTGNVNIVNEPTGVNGEIRFANSSGSMTTIGGTFTARNDESGTNKLIYLGNAGSISFNGDLTLINNSDATNSFIRLNYSPSSTNLYNENITIESTVPNCDGITFGENSGTGTLADTKTVTIGTGGFVSGDLMFRNFTQIGNTPQTLITSGTASFTNRDSDWGGNAYFTGSNMLTHGTTYRGTAYLEKYGSGSDGSTGNNHFFGDTELKNLGSGYFLMGSNNSDVFDGNLIMNNLGTSYMHLAHNSIGNTIAGNLTINNTASGTNNHIYITNTDASDLSIGGTVTISNNTPSASGNIYFPNVGDISVAEDLFIFNTSSGGSNNVYACSGGSSPTLNIGGNLLIENNTSSTTSDIHFGYDPQSAITVGGTSSFTNNGTGTNSRMYVINYGTGVFNGEVSLINHSIATNSDINVSNTTSAITAFNDNIYLTNDNANADGISFGASTGTSTLADTKTVTIVGGFVAGRLYFRNFTQIGTTPQTLITTGTTRFENYDSDWGGNVFFTGAEFYTRGTNYRGTSYLEKFGTGNNGSYGGNHFFANSELKNLGSGYFLMGNSLPDTFDGNVIMNNEGTDALHLAYSSVGNTIAGDLTITNIANGATNNLSVCYGTGSTINIGGNTTISNLHSGTNGDIQFPYQGNITHTGNITAINNSTGTNAHLLFANSSSSSLLVDGDMTINNTGGNTTKRVYLGNQGDVTLNGNLSITNTSNATNSEVFCNYSPNSLNNYNGNITLVNNNPAADGIQFGANNGAGILANGHTVSIGTGGFSAGTLLFRNFTQVGNTPQNITITNAGTIFNNYDSQWNGAVDFKGPRHFTRGTVYNSDAILEKTNITNDASNGGNTYNGNAQIINSGSGYFMPANAVGDDFNGNVSFIQNGNGIIHPNYNCVSTYAGNININYTSGQIFFGAAGNGRAILDGLADQYINDLASSTLPLFRDFQVAKVSGDIYLNIPIEVTTELDLDQGIVYTTNTNLLSMQDNATVSSVSNASHLDGPIEKIGNDTFTFPVGDNGFYRPISMSSPSNTSARFRSQYFDVDPNTVGYNDGQKESSLGYISDCEYWILNREATSNNVSVTLSYDTYRGPCSGVTDPTLLKVARWDAATSEWKNHGNGGSTGTTSGTVSTAGVVTNFSPFTFASDDIDVNPLPITLISFKATANGSTVDLDWQTGSEINNDYFTIERSVDGITFYPILTTDGAGNSTTTLDYHETDLSPISGMSYYRLKQTDFNGEFSYSHVEVVELTNGGSGVNIFPNPIAANQGDLTLVFATTGNKEIKIIDQLGKIVLAQISTSDLLTNINVSSLQSGAYFVQINESGHTYTERFIIE